ncbi:MAG: hypothetical protein ACRD1R_13375 [Acidobacteriota bacterium]
MNDAKLILTACLLIFSVALVTAAELNQKTELTVREPIQIPGMTLQPGEYVFKLADSQQNRHIVQVFRAGEEGNEEEILATILAIASERQLGDGELELTFYETPAGVPDALRAWYWTGNATGHEFIYDEDEAFQIAEASGQEVPIRGEDDVATERARPGQRTEFETQAEDEDRDAQFEQEQTVAQAQPRQEQQFETQQQFEEEEEEQDFGALPGTASPLALMALIGLLSLGGAAAVRALRR